MYESLFDYIVFYKNTDIDNVLFSHAGMSKDFVNLHVPKSKYDDVDDVLDYVCHLEG